jgi:hypothetical protein
LGENLGEFSPFGQLFTLGRFFITERAQIYEQNVSMVQIIYLDCPKVILAAFGAIQKLIKSMTASQQKFLFKNLFKKFC